LAALPARATLGHVKTNLEHMGALVPLVSSNRYVIGKIQFDFNIDCAHRHDSAE